MSLTIQRTGSSDIAIIINSGGRGQNPACVCHYHVIQVDYATRFVPDDGMSSSSRFRAADNLVVLINVIGATA